MLSPRDITYEKRKAIKSQVIPDFIIEWTEVQTPGPPDMFSSWTMYFDGSKRAHGAGAGVILVSPKGDRMRYVLQLNFSKASNNEAEYDALLHDMRMVKACGSTRLTIYGDSNLVIQQTMKQCDAMLDTMASYRDLYNTLEGEFDGCELTHIGRNSNEEADALSNIGLTRAPLPPGVFLEQIDQRSIKVPHSGAAPVNTEVTDSMKAIEEADEAHAPEDVFLVEPAWTAPNLAYILRKELPK
jgi:ribonuclease HI